MKQIKNTRDLAKYIKHKANTAINSPGAQESDLRQDCLSRYRMDLWGDEVDGRSKFVTSEVFEAIEWAMPKVAQVFLSSDLVKFQPSNPQDQDAAKVETSILNTLIKQNPEYWGCFFDVMKDALLYPTSYLKTSIEMTSEREVQRFIDVTDDEIDMIQNSYVGFDGEISIEDHDQGVGQDGAVKHSFSLVLDPKPKPKLVFECVPPEECLVDNEHTTTDLDSCNFVAHKCEKDIYSAAQYGFFG